MSDNMPFEIQVEIMERLPVKSLIRFRCVSKPWKSIIDGSKFINDHTANHTHPHHLLVRYHSHDDLKYVSIPDNNDGFPQHKFPINVPESVKRMTKPNISHKTITLDSELDQVEIDGVIYWLACDKKTYVDVDTREWDDLIISFDLTTEEFTEIYLPDDLTRSAFDLHISKLKGSVVVLEVDTCVVKRVFDVWKMEHGGVSKTFSKLYTINKPEASILRVLAFRKSGEPIIEREIDSEDENALFVYEHNSKLINDTGIYGKEDLFSAISYVETLLLLDY